MKRLLTAEELEQLRGDIVLGSMYYSDYKNSLGLDSHVVCNFFDGYVEQLFEYVPAEVGGMEAFEVAYSYDTPEELRNYYLDCVCGGFDGLQVEE